MQTLLLTVAKSTKADGGRTIKESAGQECHDLNNLAPCNCSTKMQHHIDLQLYGKRSHILNCNRIPLANVSNILKRVPAREWPALDFHLSPSDANKSISADVLGNHTVVTIHLTCPFPNYSLQFNPNAFRSSNNSLLELFENQCDLGHFNFDFLFGFNQFRAISFNQTHQHLQLANRTGIPPNLDSLAILNVARDFKQWTTFPNLSQGLKVLVFDKNDINDVEMDRFLNWTLKTSADTLQYLALNENNLTRIPRQLSNFKSLKSFSLSNQKSAISSIAKGSVIFSCEDYLGYRSLRLSGNRIASIQPGAFQGCFIIINSFPKIFITCSDF